MPTWTNLRVLLDGVIYTNANSEITAALHNGFEHELIDELGALQYKGLAVPATVAGALDGPAFFAATEAGTYTNFGGQTVLDGELVFLKYDGISGWTKDVVYTNAPIVREFDTSVTANIAEGKLVTAIVFVSASNQTVTIETSGGAADILDAEPMTAGQVFVISQPLYSNSGAIPLSVICSVTSISNNILKIYIR